MYRGKVVKVDTKGVYVQTAEYGTLGPCQAVVANYAVGDMVLCVNVGDEASPELVVVGQLSAAGSAASIPDGSITSAKIANGTIVDEDVSSSAAISRSKISGLPTSSTDNRVARFDGTGGALQGSGVTIDDSGYISGTGMTRSEATQTFDQWYQGGVRRFLQQTTGTFLNMFAADDAGAWYPTGKVVYVIDRATGKFTLRQVGSTAGLEFGVGGPRIMAGTGSPESVVSAPVGSLWLRTDSSTTLYVKQTGTGNTGWIAK